MFSSLAQAVVTQTQILCRRKLLLELLLKHVPSLQEPIGPALSQGAGGSLCFKPSPALSQGAGGSLFFKPSLSAEL